VGTPAWFEWLESATTFAFAGPSGRFTARKEARARGGLYWKAYHTANGTLHRAYLGLTSDLTLDRLTNAAATLAAASAPTGPSTSATPAPRSAAPVVPTNLLATKLNIPPARAQLVIRPRLFTRLEAGLRSKLILIAAPAGFGKTTLVSAWVASGGRRVAWLSLDQQDNDPTRFLTYLVAALRTVMPGLGEGVLGVLQSSQPPPAETVLTTLINEIATIPNIPDNFVTVLDDYHVIDAEAIDQALAFLIEHMPPQMHLVITSREDPQLPLARLRARDQLTELRAGDLRFTPSEAAGFLNQVMALDLSAENIDALENRTEGWIAGLQLAALALRDHVDHTGFIRTFTGSSRFIIDYLAEEVLGRQPEEVRSFLLRTSVLERMCAPLCDEVLNGNSEAAPSVNLPQLMSSQAMLEKLDRANLFIVPLDNERRWYRYHHLFADLLRQRLLRSTAPSAGDAETRVNELHLRASQWYEDNGLEIEAFHHAAAANDVERAERIIQGAGMPLYFRGTVAPVLNWLESLPKTVLDATPSLWVMSASAQLQVDHTAVEQKLQAAEAALQGTLQGTEPDDRTRDIIGRIASMRATVAVVEHDTEAIIAQSRRALEYLHPNNLPVRTATTWSLGHAYQLQGDRAAAGRAYEEVITISKSLGDSVYTVAAISNLGQVQEADNRLHLAAETYKRVLQMAGDPPQPINCNSHLGLARIYYQWNDLEAAEQQGQLCLEQTRHLATELVDTVASSEVLLARLRLVQGDVGGATAILAKAEAFVRRNNFLFRMPDVVAAQVLTLIHQGNLAQAAHLAQTHGLPLSQARVHLAQGNTSAALALLEPLRQEAEAKGWADERLNVIVLQSAALHAHGETDKAVQLLGEALALAEPEGFIRIFVDEGLPMAQLLSEAAAHGVMPEYAGKLLAVFEAKKPESKDKSYLPPAVPVGVAASAQPLIEPLSERELEVLRLLGTELSGPEVARGLTVSLNTVRTHTKNIYNKLGVNNRRAAVRRAEELHLL
jgi:LuxR family maltose regulon positive regulatory protein